MVRTGTILHIGLQIAANLALLLSRFAFLIGKIALYVKS